MADTYDIVVVFKEPGRANLEVTNCTIAELPQGVIPPSQIQITRADGSVVTVNYSDVSYTDVKKHVT